MIVAGRPGGNSQRLKNRVLHGFRGAFGNKFHARGWFQENVGLRDGLAFLRAVVGIDRHAGESYDPQWLRHSVIEQLHMKRGMGRGVDKPPELRLARLHPQDGRLEISHELIRRTRLWVLTGADGDVVDRQIPRRNLAADRRERGKRHGLGAHDEGLHCNPATAGWMF